MAGFGLLPLVKLNLVWAFNQGWRVQQMLGRRRPGGLPVWVWAIIALLTALCSAMVATGAAMEASMPHAGSRTMLFGTAALFSIFWATMLWFWWWKEHQQFLGEYELRMQLRQAGWEQLKIDREITQLRIRGWIAVDPNE
jgi:Zn-dependent protease with chaperone function